MHPYSHLILANKIENSIQPENLQEYYWGAVAPDIRYISGLERSKTHLPPQDITGLISQYPHLKSFLQGYLVHCLIDKIPVNDLFYSRFPLSLTKGKLNRQHISAIFEMYYFETAPMPLEVSGNFNAVLKNMGIAEEDCAKFTQFIRPYIASTTPYDQAASLLSFLGLENDPRIEKYLSAVETIQKNRILKTLLFNGIRVGKLTDRIVKMLSASMNVK